MSKKKKTIIGVVVAVVAALAITGTVLGVVLSGGGPYTGKVTDKASGEPLAGVSVTDGRNVVKTAEDGTFTLDGWRKTRFITVTTPAGYITENFYIPVSRDVESYDFALDKSEATAKKDHGFLQVSDTEVSQNGADEAWLNHVRGVIKDTDPAFLIHTGDICYEAGLKQHIQDMNTETMGVPVRYIIGNHDYVDGKYGEKLFESIYGPIWYSFEVGNVHYVVTPIHYGADRKSGYDADDRWRWLENDLANTDPDMKIVIFNHSNSTEEDYVFSFDGKDLDLKKHNLIAWVFGHYHYNYVKNNDGVLEISTARPDCGGIDSSASGTRWISVTADGKVSTKMYYNNLPAAPAAPENSVWTTNLTDNVLFTDTISVSGKIYTATADDDYPRNCGVYCLDEKTGKILWNVPTENSVKNNLVYVDGKIIAQDCGGNVLCMEAESGKTIWTAKVDLKRSLGTTTGLCTDGEAVYAGSSCDVVAYNLTDGKLLWEYHRDRGDNSSSEMMVIGDKLIISPHWDALVALDKKNGNLLWDNRDSDIRFRSSTPLMLDERTLLVADDDSIMVVNAESGDITQKTTLEDYVFSSSGQPAAKDGIAYIPTASHGLIAFEIASQKILWEVKTDMAMVFTAPYMHEGNAYTVEGTPILVDGQIIFGGADGNLYRVNAADGTVLSKMPVGAPIFGKVVAADENTVIVADFAGRVSKVKLG